MNANTFIGITLLFIAIYIGGKSTDPLLALSIILAMLGIMYIQPRPMLKLLKMQASNPADFFAALDELERRAEEQEDESS